MSDDGQAQIELNFTVGITDRYPELMDVIRAALERTTRLQKQVAADMDKSPSALSREILESGDRVFKAQDLPKLLDALPDTQHLILDWFIERYLDTLENKQQRANDVIEKLGPALLEALRIRNEYAGDDLPTT